MDRNQIRELIQSVFRQGVYSAEGQRAIKELAKIGEPAVDAFVKALKKPPKSELHPKDVLESVEAVFCGFARVVPDKLIDLWEAGAVDAVTIYWALGDAAGDRSLATLIGGLKHKDQYARWAAAESLIRRHDRRAVLAIVESLRDRSQMVKSAIVFAMKADKLYDRPEAIPLLQRIVDSKTIENRSPYVWEAAKNVLRRILRSVGQRASDGRRERRRQAKG